MKASTTLLLLIALAGCAGPVWVKPGSTEEDFNLSMAKCRMQASMIPQRPYGGAGQDLQDTGTRMQFFSDCMYLDGWRRRED